MTYNTVILAIVYTLIAVLLITLIVLVINVIKTMKKVDKIVDDVDYKVQKLNGVFNLVDVAADSLTSISNKVTGLVSNLITDFVMKRRKKKEDNDYYE